MKNETPPVLPYGYYPSLAIARERPPRSAPVVTIKKIKQDSSTKDVNDPASWDIAWFANYE